MRGDFGAIAVLAWRADNRLDRKGEPGKVLEQLGHLTALPEELVGVGQILVLAAAAPSEDRAGCRHPTGRANQDLDQIGLGKISMIAKHTRPNPVARKG